MHIYFILVYIVLVLVVVTLFTNVLFCITTPITTADLNSPIY